MPRNWLYYIALICPLALRIVLLNTGFVEWLWYQHHEQAYYMLTALREQPYFLAFLGGWKLPIFIIAIICWWNVEDSDEGIPAQFLLVPLGYVPFAMAADILNNGLLDEATFYVYPLVILPIGYV